MSEESDGAETVEFEITPELVWWMTDVAEDVFKKQYNPHDQSIDGPFVGQTSSYQHFAEQVRKDVVTNNSSIYPWLTHTVLSGELKNRHSTVDGEPDIKELDDVITTIQVEVSLLRGVKGDLCSLYDNNRQSLDSPDSFREVTDCVENHIP